MVDKLEPVAYLHTLHMEGGQTYDRLTMWNGVDPYEPRRTAFGFPDRDYSPEYHVTTTPLYAATPANGEQVERVAKAMYDATHAGLRNCYAWEDAWEDHQEHHRDRYYKEARAAIAAMNPTPTEDARSRVKVLEEAAKIARSTHDEWQRFRKAGGVSLGAETYDEHDCDHAARVAIGIATAIRALGNKETDRHG